MKDVLFIVSLLVIMIPVVLVIGGLSPKVERKLDEVTNKMASGITPLIIIWTINVLVVINLVPLALGRYGFKII